MATTQRETVEKIQGAIIMNPNKAMWEKGDFTDIAAERVENGGGHEEKETKHEVKGIEMVVGSQVVPQLGTAEISRSGTPAAGRDAVMRNFILQQGFEDPAPAVCPL